MSSISALELLRVPKRWPPNWQRTFTLLISPIHLIRSIRRKALPFVLRESAQSLSEDELQAFRSDAALVDKQMWLALDDLHGVAPKTWKAGLEIRLESGSVLFQLQDLEVMERISIPSYREHLLSEIRSKVIQRSSEFREIPLLENLLDAMTEERDREAVQLGGGATPETDWSRPDGPTQWAKVFGVSVRTLNRRHEKGEIRIKKLSTKCWMIALTDLPTPEKEKHRPRKRPT